MADRFGTNLVMPNLMPISGRAVWNAFMASPKDAPSLTTDTAIAAVSETRTRLAARAPLAYFPKVFGKELLPPDLSPFFGRGCTAVLAEAFVRLGLPPDHLGPDAGIGFRRVPELSLLACFRLWPSRLLLLERDVGGAGLPDPFCFFAAEALQFSFGIDGRIPTSLRSMSAPTFSRKNSSLSSP